MNAENHPVFSDFSHVASLQGIGQLTFAVGLREEHPDQIVNRMLPLSRHVPSPVKEKKVAKKKVVVEEKACSRPECISRKERLGELNSENETYRIQFRALEAKLAASQNKIALTEKSIGMSEEKNDSLRGQIEDTQARIFTSEAEVEKGEVQNESLRKVLLNLQQDIERLKVQTEAVEENTVQVIATNSGQTVVFSRYPSNPAHSKLAHEVKYLGSKNQDDSDDD